MGTSRIKMYYGIYGRAEGTSLLYAALRLHLDDWQAGLSGVLFSRAPQAFQIVKFACGW